MTTGKIDIKINLTNQQKQQLYSKISFSFQFQKDKLIKINQKISDTCNSSHAPFILLQFPTMDFKGINISAFDQNHFDKKQIIKNNKVYQAINFKSPQRNKFIQNLVKSFEKLNQIDNLCQLDLSLYNVNGIMKKQSLWNGALIKGQIRLDSKFMTILKELLEKVSPQFLNSPIIVLLQLLQSCQMCLNLSDVSVWDGELSQFIRDLIKVNPSQDKQFIQLLQKTNQDFCLRITLGQLFSIKVKGSSKAIRLLLKYL